MPRLRSREELSPQCRPDAVRVPPVVSGGLQSALLLLHDAAVYAADLSCDPWQFAVDWSTCRDRQISPNDLRWLIHAGFVEHELELRQSGPHEEPSYRPDRIAIGSLSSFVLNAAGRNLARVVLGQHTDAPTSHSVPQTGRSDLTIPSWDKTSRTLHLGSEIVKRFRVPARNQEVVLAAFQEEGWPPSIDDPLSPAGEVDSKHRLHETIRRLNNNQRTQILHFYGNGNGRAICWEIAINAPTK